ncbi:unnamed protein product [Oikopleura dioica]|uniref:Homeobox domain-containing protein n=1 Tax=Oikopleura dioica TaxID=34765 RepID=E4WZT8_OIKDI|nr:unnamed protein product [Oikopleura dioica]
MVISASSLCMTAINNNHFAKEMDNAVTSDSQEARQETPSPSQRHHSPPFASQSETSPRAVPETIRVPVPTLAGSLENGFPGLLGDPNALRILQASINLQRQRTLPQLNIPLESLQRYIGSSSWPHPSTTAGSALPIPTPLLSGSVGSGLLTQIPSTLQGENNALFNQPPFADPAMMQAYAYRYGSAGRFPSNGHRKNATRENTAPLKKWLEEHMRNPYPTKAEKITLAIISSMSLTQVSTWFANARRRLKKENRVTWETPRETTGSDEHETEELARETDSRNENATCPSQVSSPPRRRSPVMSTTMAASAHPSTMPSLAGLRPGLLGVAIHNSVPSASIYQQLLMNHILRPVTSMPPLTVCAPTIKQF